MRRDISVIEIVFVSSGLELISVVSPMQRVTIAMDGRKWH